MRRSFHRQVQLANWASEHAMLTHVPQPDDWPSEARIDAGKLSPLYHGHYLIGLSPAFAAVNALRLVAHGGCALRTADEQALLSAAWAWGRTHQALQPEHGLRQCEWPSLVESLCHHFNRRHGQFVRTSQPWRHARPTRDEFFIAVERLIVSRHVLLSLLVGAQFLVVRGYTPKSLLLFDSGGRCWIEKSSLALAGSGPLARHRLAAPATITLRRTF